MEAMGWTAAIVGGLLFVVGSIPSWLKKAAEQQPAPAIQIPSAVTDIPTSINSDDENRRQMFDRLMLLQSLLEEFNVPVEQQRAVVEPLVLRLFPFANKSKE